jgi:hypothetical protein
MDPAAAPPTLGNDVRISSPWLRVSPWLSSLAVLNLLVLTASAVALAKPGAIDASDVTLTALVISYLIALWYRCARHPSDLLEMDTMFLVFFGIYVVLPIVAFLVGSAADDVPTFFDLIAHFDSGVIVVGLAALFSFLVGYSSAIGPALARLVPRADSAWRPTEGLTISATLLLAGATLVAILVRIIGIDTLIESEYARAYEATAGLGLLAGGLMLIEIGLVVLHLTLAERGGRTPILPWILFAVLALLMLRIGRRRIVLEAGLALLVAHHFYVRRVRLRTLVVAGAASLLTFAVVGLARAYLAEGFGGVLTRLADEFGVGDIVRLMAEPVTVLLALTETMNQVPAQEPFWLGRTFVEAFEILVPLPIHPDRPLAPSQWFVNLIDPTIAAAGGGYSYALLAEGYLNFGVLGAAIVSFAEGVVVRGIVTYRRLFPSGQSRCLVYAVAVSLTIMMIRGDFASLLKAGIVGLVVPAVLVGGWLGRRRTPRTFSTDFATVRES